MAESEAGTVLTIGDLARRSGVSVSTIRAWEQRYGLLTPTRSQGGHRRYSLEDLRRISAVQLLVAGGATLAAAAERVMATSDDERQAGVRSTSPPAPLPTAGLEPKALEAAYRATRSLLHIECPAQAVEVLVSLVRELGGTVVPADESAPDALHLDLSLGEVPPLVPVAESYSVARLHLERVLPTVVEDARRAVAMSRRLSRASRGGSPGR